MYLAGSHFFQMPGSSAVPDRTLRAICGQTIDRRVPDFGQVGKTGLEGVRTIFKTKHHVFCLSVVSHRSVGSSGTSGLWGWRACVQRRVRYPGFRRL